jgi:hypothetical protein
MNPSVKSFLEGAGIALIIAATLLAINASLPKEKLVDTTYRVQCLDTLGKAYYEIDGVHILDVGPNFMHLEKDGIIGNHNITEGGTCVYGVLSQTVVTP